MMRPFDSYIGWTRVQGEAVAVLVVEFADLARLRLGVHLGNQGKAKRNHEKNVA